MAEATDTTGPTEASDQEASTSKPSYEELYEYREDVERRLEDLLRVVARVAAGDYSERPAFPVQDDALARFSVGFRFMIEDLELARHDEARRREELEAANDRLRFQKAVMESQAEAAIEGILVVDPAGNIVSFNTRFVELWGIPDDVIERRDDDAAIESVLHKLEDPDAFLERVRYLYEHPRERSRDELQLADGRVFDRYSAPVVGSDGELFGRVWYFRDVTAERQAAARLEEAVEQLKLMDRTKTRFINTAAHELATPLTPIKLQLHMMKGRMDDMRDEDARTIAILDRNVNRLAELVKDVLDGARVQAGRLPVTPAPMDLTELVDEVVESFEAPAIDQGIELETVHDRDNLGIVADPARIQQVLFNYLSNALKYTPAGGHVTVRVEQRDGHARIMVKDTGPGLTGEQIERLFQPFSQVHENGSDAGGTGLGLYICKGIIEEHGGDVWCRSDGPGKGAEFGFQLPVGDPTES